MREQREFKVHDLVAKRSYGGDTKIGNVFRMTKTMVMVQFPGARTEARYRHDGRSVGGSEWSTHFIDHATDQDFQDVAWQDLKNLAGRLDKIAEQYGRKDAALQLQIHTSKLIAHLTDAEDQK